MPNKEEILRKTNNGLDVFRRYIPGEWRVGRNFLNPLYEDRKASCNIFFDRRNGCYRLKDFGNDDFSGDCFDIVGKMKGLDCRNPKDFVGILETINQDLCLGLGDVGDVRDLETHRRNGASRGLGAQNALGTHGTPGTLEAPGQTETLKKPKPYSVKQQLFSAKESSFWSQYGILPETRRRKWQA